MAQQTTRRSKNSSSGSTKRSTSSRSRNGNPGSVSTSRSSSSRSRGTDSRGSTQKRTATARKRTTPRKRSTPTKSQGPVAEAAATAKDGAVSAGSTVADAVKKAKVPLIAAGTGLAGLAGGAMLAGRNSRKRVLGVPMPRKSTTKNLANASKNVATFGEGMGSLASEVHRITTGLSDASAGRRSPIEVLLDGLTNRRR